MDSKEMAMSTQTRMPNSGQVMDGVLANIVLLSYTKCYDGSRRDRFNGPPVLLCPACGSP